ncbi:MAG: peptidase S8 [Candidatus Eremiobacteraeota bacterium]|nr:peptidase S8 [Candidatus Eremiobacteraeota bacterium]
MILKRRAALLLTIVLAACAHGSHVIPLPQQNNAPLALDSLKALPGDSLKALPGDSLKALPGAAFACTSLLTADRGSCSVAVNTNIKPQSSPTTPLSLLDGLKPTDLQSRYLLPSANAGGLVAIVDAYDDPSAEAEMGVYRATMGLPACTTANGCFRKLNEAGVAGSYPAPNTGWSVEVALDLDVVSAVCPHCKIALVEARSSSLTDLGETVDTAAALHPRAVSNSYYAPETPDETNFEKYYTHSGMVITVSSGDEAAAFYPAASVHVLSVGGTTLDGSAGAWNEKPWFAGGQGCSAYLAAPVWQHTACRTRSTVDLAAVADPQTGVTIFSLPAGGWVVAGGTSIGAPLIAAAYALSNNASYIEYPYGHRSGFYDIPPAGFDYATGLGTPRGVAGL